MDNNENISKEDINSSVGDIPDTDKNFGTNEIDPSVLQTGDSCDDKNEICDTTDDNISDEEVADVHAENTDDVGMDDSDPAKEKKKKTKPPKKWYDRSINERLVAMIPGVIMVTVIIIAWLHGRDIITADTDYLTEMKLSIALAGAALLIGVFCVRLGRVWGWIVTALTPAAVFLLTEFFTHNPFEMKQPIVITNLVFYYGTALLVLFLTGSMKASVIVTAVLPMIFGLVNYYTLEFRGSPLFPWDIASAGVAADVVDNYKIVITWHICFIICAFVFIIMLGALATPRIKAKLWWLRAPVSVIAALALVLTGSFVQVHGIKELKMYPYLFSPKQVFKVNGAAVTYAYTLQYTGVQKPAGYSPENLQSVLDEFESEPIVEGEEMPNVIVIMNEAFSDLKTMVDYEQNIPVTPFIDSLTDDTVKGTLHVSVKGGNTANSEFEFLTGLPMANFTPGSIPYQQYVLGETPTFVTQLSELGYKTVGMHPYGAAGWNRDNVYPWFGFDETYFLEDFNEWIGRDNVTEVEGFTQPEKVRSYYSDAATYRKIIDLYEGKEDGQPLFVYDVTMQNHGGYTANFTDFVPNLYVNGLATRSYVNIYLSLINKSDQSFGELVNYFEAQDEPTIILMFGDHQPHDSYVKPLLDKQGVTFESGSLEEQLHRYTVPFVIWANYDIEEETDIHASINYMSTLLCEKAGIPRSSTQMYLASLYEKYPVICEGHYGDAEGNFYDATTLDSIEGIDEYRMLSYNMIADIDNILPSIYTYE